MEKRKMDKPLRIAYDELIKTITMFLIDKSWENTAKEEVAIYVDKMQKDLTQIATKEGLIKYIEQDKFSLTSILMLMEIPEEKFKRVISMIRREHRYVFSSEWSLEKTRSVLLENKVLMDDVCELLLNGANSERFKRKIPDFYRDSFKIDTHTIAKLKNHEELVKLAKRQMDAKYTAGVALTFVKKVEETIKLTCDLEGLTYVKNKSVDGLDRNYGFIIPDNKQPKILINCSYNITTSSTQSRFSESVLRTRDKIRMDGKKILTVNIIEGAGWIGRQSDLKIIYENSDYTLNLAYIGLLDQIIRYGMENEK